MWCTAQCMATLRALRYLVALDLHVLTNNSTIFIGTDTMQDMGEVDWEDREMSQSHLQIIDLVQSLSFDWSDSLTMTAVDLEYLGSLNLQMCVRVDAIRCEVVGQLALLSLLTTACRMLHSQGCNMTATQAEKLNTETGYIILETDDKWCMRSRPATRLGVDCRT